MKTARLLAVLTAMAGLASLPLMAQQVDATARQNASASAAGAHVDQSANADAKAGASRGNAGANGNAASSAALEGRRSDANSDADSRDAGDAQMRPVTGELQGKLDSKSARVGEPVVLRTTEKMKTADGFVLPRGSRLIGHVTEVQAHSKGQEQSSLGIAFDRAELKNGQSFAIHSVIESVGPSAAQLEAESMESEDAFAGSAGGGAMSGGGAAVGRSGGGLLGGGAGVVGGASSAAGGVGSSVASTAGGAFRAGGDAVGAAGNLAGDAAANVGRGVSGSAGAAGSLGAHATALPGVNALQQRGGWSFGHVHRRPAQHSLR